MTNNIMEQIEFVNISKGFLSEHQNYFQWINPEASSSQYTLDIIAVQNLEHHSKVFNQITRKKLKICSFLKNKILYMVATKQEVQYHVMQAIIEELIKNFEDFLKNKAHNSKIAYCSVFSDFDLVLLDIFDNISNLVTKIRTRCSACDKNLEIMVRNSLIEDDLASYPVSLVYIHKGHGLLIYIDRDFKVRGSEIVNTSG